MKRLIILTLLALSCGDKPKEDVDQYDRLDVANVIPTNHGTYNPKVDSTYFFPADSNDIVTLVDFANYKIKTILFPVLNKYVISFDESAGRIEKVKYREYKLQVEITDPKGLYIKRVISKYDFPDSALIPSPDNYFIREVKFKGLENNEFLFDLRVCFLDANCSPWIKYYVHLVEGVRFEQHPEAYDSTLQAPWDINQ